MPAHRDHRAPRGRLRWGYPVTDASVFRQMWVTTADTAATDSALTATAAQVPIACPSGCEATKSTSAIATSAAVATGPASLSVRRAHPAPPARRIGPPSARTPVSSATPKATMNVAAAATGRTVRAVMALSKYPSVPVHGGVDPSAPLSPRPEAGG